MELASQASWTCIEAVTEILQRTHGLRSTRNNLPAQPSIWGPLGQQWPGMQTFKCNVSSTASPHYTSAFSLSICLGRISNFPSFSLRLDPTTVSFLGTPSSPILLTDEQRLMQGRGVRAPGEAAIQSNARNNTMQQAHRPHAKHQASIDYLPESLNRTELKWYP